MINALKSFLMLATLALSSISVAHEDPVEAELHELLNAFLAGASGDDAAIHDRFWAEDLVYTSSSGERFGKAEIMDGLGNAPAGEDAPCDFDATLAMPNNCSRSVASAVVSVPVVVPAEWPLARPGWSIRCCPSGRSGNGC